MGAGGDDEAGVREFTGGLLDQPGHGGRAVQIVEQENGEPAAEPGGERSVPESPGKVAIAGIEEIDQVLGGADAGGQLRKAKENGKRHGIDPGVLDTAGEQESEMPQKGGFAGARIARDEQAAVAQRVIGGEREGRVPGIRGLFAEAAQIRCQIGVGYGRDSGLSGCSSASATSPSFTSWCSWTRVASQ